MHFIKKGGVVVEKVVDLLNSASQDVGQDPCIDFVLSFVDSFGLLVLKLVEHEGYHGVVLYDNFDSKVRLGCHVAVDVQYCFFELIGRVIKLVLNDLMYFGVVIVPVLRHVGQDVVKVGDGCEIVCGVSYQVGHYVQVKHNEGLYNVHGRVQKMNSPEGIGEDPCDGLVACALVFPEMVSIVEVKQAEG